MLSAFQASGPSEKNYSCELPSAVVDPSVVMPNASWGDATDSVEWQTGIMSSVLGLPPELLIEIFTLYSKDPDVGPGLSITPLGGVSTPVISLSHICSSWREVVISTPHLWTWITVDLGYVSRGTQRALELVQLYIRRSSNARLTLGIQALRQGSGANSDREVYIEEFSEIGWEIFQLFLYEHSRWYEVSLKLRWTLFDQASEVLVGLLPAMDGKYNFPQLEVLKIGWESSYWPRRSTNWFIDQFKDNVPVLHTLSLPYFSPSFPFPFSQLTCVNLFDDDSWISAPAMLKSCSIIHKLELACGPERIWTTANIVITSTSLKSLTILMKDFVPAYETLSTLTLPSLVSLHLMTPDPGLSGFALARSTSSDWKRTFWFKNFIAFIERSGCQLETFIIDGNIFLEDHLLRLFALTTNVKHLSIRTLSWYEPILTNGLFRALTLHHSATDVELLSISSEVQNKRTNLLPNLTSLEMYFSDLDSILSYRLVSPENIFSMIESRTKLPFDSNEDALARLTSLDVFDFRADFDTEKGKEWAGKFRSDVEPRLREFESLGMFKMNVKLNI
ncbi:hypothetical protein K435DRAFT_967635 [Dendrothele bispora CBS 962.96]|uniref:Uncharacterized protein n=1 Tax=Dendrothele bispora (strain CBS 962.96) TaxID=1314807 RepID=A0A4S8LSV1_DENBC|nr:hypothetical protein K435DRAFT_967635 [Dendrothele bispora CBS 962.96]